SPIAQFVISLYQSPGSGELLHTVLLRMPTGTNTPQRARQNWTQAKDIKLRTWADIGKGMNSIRKGKNSAAASAFVKKKRLKCCRKKVKNCGPAYAVRGLQQQYLCRRCQAEQMEKRKATCEAEPSSS